MKFLYVEPAGLLQHFRYAIDCDPFFSPMENDPSKRLLFCLSSLKHICVTRYISRLRSGPQMGHTISLSIGWLNHDQTLLLYILIRLICHTSILSKCMMDFDVVIYIVYIYVSIYICVYTFTYIYIYIDCLGSIMFDNMIIYPRPDSGAAKILTNGCSTTTIKKHHQQ